MTIDYFKRHSNSFFEGKKATLTVEYENGFGEVIPAGSTVTLLRKSGSHSAFDIVWHVKIGGEFQQVNIDSVLCMDLQLIHQQKMKKANLIIPTLFSIPDSKVESVLWSFNLYTALTFVGSIIAFIILLMLFYWIKDSIKSYQVNKKLKITINKPKKHKPNPKFKILSAYWWNPFFWIGLLIIAPIYGFIVGAFNGLFAGCQNAYECLRDFDLK